MAKFCQNCGAEVNENQDICLKCGVKVSKNAGGNANDGSKSKLVAGLLGIFLGTIGVHNFYLGYTGKAIAQLLISLLSFGFLAPVSAVWGLIEGIMILTGKMTVDAHGNPLGE